MNPNLWRDLIKRTGGVSILRPSVDAPVEGALENFRRAMATAAHAVPFTYRPLSRRYTYDARAVRRVRLPFPAVRIEISPPHDSQKPGQGDIVIAWEAVSTEGSDCIEFVALYRAAAGAPWTWATSGACVDAFADGRLGITHDFGQPQARGVPECSERQADFNERAASLLIGFLANLQAPGARIVPSPGNAAKPKIKAKHLARGALPFDDYHVVVIDPQTERVESESCGGTHRSPREHLRRGHPRTLRSGRTVWVRPTLVAAGAPGAIHQSYAVESRVAVTGEF